MIVKGTPDRHGELYDTNSVARPPKPTLRTAYLPPEPWFHSVGVDLGSVNDSTAITVLEVHRGWEVTNEHFDWTNTVREVRRELDLHYIVRLLHRPRLGTDYERIIDQVQSILDDLPRLPGGAVLAVDGTGLGAPVVQRMRQRGLHPIGVAITAGANATLTGRDWSVPKSMLVGELRLIMHRKRLKIAQGFAAREKLAAELAAFTARLSPSGRATFEAAGSEHDDTVLSLCIAFVAAKNRPQPIRRASLEALVLAGKVIEVGSMP